MTPESRIEVLDATLPVALFPVRLETRFMADVSELRIRIYPDALHIDSHEPELTAEEIDAGRRYWTGRWDAPADTTQASAAWNEVARGFGPQRALWVVRRTTPTNVDAIGGSTPPTFPGVDTRDALWTRAATARLLPNRWLAIGFRDGVEIFRKEGSPVPPRLAVGPDPAGFEQGSEAPAESSMPDDAVRWVADYDAALDRGMAITVREAETAGGLGEGVGQLIVVGVNDALVGDDGAESVAATLLGHLYSDGLGFVLPGAPSNNTEAARTGDADPTEALTRQLDPALPRQIGVASGARLVEAAFGLAGDAAQLALAPHADFSERRTTSLAIDVLWAATLGQYLDQLMDPLGDDATIQRVRGFAKAFLFPGGPLPAVRIGKQPYGLLPIVASGRYRQSVDGDVTDGDVEAILRRLRGFWQGAIDGVPRIGGSEDVDSELLHLLQMAPLAEGARFRRVLGPELEPNTQGLQTHAMAQQYYATLLAQHVMGWSSLPRVASFTSDPRAYPLRVPWVQGEPGKAPLEPNYLIGISKAIREETGRSQLDQRVSPGSLLEALVTNATLNEFDRAAARAVLTPPSQIARAQAGPGRVTFRIPESVRIDGPTPAPARPGMPGAVRVDTPRELGELILPEVTGGAKVAAWIAEQLRNPGPDPQPAIRDLLNFLHSLDQLAQRPSDEIDRALRGVLDCYSHRIDAWYTALATSRLEKMRKKRASGVHVGGYGWVEDLRPGFGLGSLGYLHAPSLEHANAAALLRSGHLAHRDGEYQTMNIDLRSERVRLATELLEGVAQGQPLAALLGYRIERGLRDRDLRLARYVGAFRRRFPLRGTSKPPATQPAEELAARDVVDGVALLERWRTERTRVLAGLSVPTQDWAAIAAELDRSADSLDAVSDLLVAESVFQTTAGNPERARAALAVLDRQERPIDPQVIRTPRDGFTYVQRLLVLLQDDEVPTGWRQQTDPRGAAEPRLNAWIARILGDHTRFRFTGRILTDDKPPREVATTLREIDLSPVGLMMAARKSGGDSPSELEARIALQLSGSVLPDDVNPRLEIDAGPPIPGPIGLQPLLQLLEWIGEVTGDRPADARDLALSEDDVEPGFDVPELKTRADAAVAAFDKALVALDGALRARTPTEKRLRTVLVGAAAVGVQEAVPRAILPTENSASTLAALLDQGRAVRERMLAARAELDRIEAPSGSASVAPTPRAQVELETARIRAIFGADFPVLPRFRAANAADLAASLAEQEALCGGDRLAPSAWLQRMALVRPEADTLLRVLTAGELLGGPPSHSDFRVAQLPHHPGQRWLALPLEAGAVPRGDVAISLLASGLNDPSGFLAGLACDDWAETIPAAEQVTGLSFHYDAPGARAPNAVLLAVPADPQAQSWSLDELVDVVREATELAKIRMVGPSQLTALGSVLPTIYLPENFRHDVPSVNVGALTHRIETGAGILGRTV